MKPTLWQLTLRRWAELASLPVTYALFAAVVLCSVAIGPFGTYDSMPIAQRLGFWLLAHTVGWTIGIALVTPIRFGLERLGLHRILSFIAGGAIASFAIVPVFLWMLTRELGGTFSAGDFAGSFLLVATLVVLLTFLVAKWTGAELFPSKGEEQPDDPHDAGAHHPDKCPLQSRIAREKRGVLYAMVAQDHYVEFITDKGSDLALMRLSDAIDYTDADHGLRIHRSAWISRWGLGGVEKDGRNLRVVLPDGRRLPVARSFEKALREFISADGNENMLPA